ncbi:lysR substrate binding domain protein [Paenibacillus macerans]|uniref:LysR substrate binding domain protein n=1 Tax=Paenibacillus macerans TaxID=44252 RepID=A0A090Y9T1_PAEMA|nr:lysR substrate binding domain protein [Paenibacillus macerans]
MSTNATTITEIAKNVGGTILPKSYGKTDVSDKVAIIPLADPAPQKRYLVYLKDSLESSIISAFVDHLISF